MMRLITFLGLLVTSYSVLLHNENTGLYSLLGNHLQAKVKANVVSARASKIHTLDASLVCIVQVPQTTFTVSVSSSGNNAGEPVTVSALGSESGRSTCEGCQFQFAIRPVNSPKGNDEVGRIQNKDTASLHRNMVTEGATFDPSLPEPSDDEGSSNKYFGRFHNHGTSNLMGPTQFSTSNTAVFIPCAPETEYIAAVRVKTTESHGNPKNKWHRYRTNTVRFTTLPFGTLSIVPVESVEFPLTLKGSFNRPVPTDKFSVSWAATPQVTINGNTQLSATVPSFGTSQKQVSFELTLTHEFCTNLRRSAKTTVATSECKNDKKCPTGAALDESLPQKQVKPGIVALIVVLVVVGALGIVAIIGFYVYRRRQRATRVSHILGPNAHKYAPTSSENGNSPRDPAPASVNNADHAVV